MTGRAGNETTERELLRDEQEREAERIRRHISLRHPLGPDISFLDRTRAPLQVTAAILLALAFIAFAVYVHYNFDQAPHRMYKVLAGVTFLVILFVRAEWSIMLLPFAFPYTAQLPVTPIPMLNSWNVLLAALLLAWIGRAVLRGRQVFDPSPWNLPLTLFIVGILLSTVFGAFYSGEGAGELYRSIQRTWSAIMGFLLFFVTYNTIRTMDQVRRLAFLFCLGAGLGVFGVLSEYGSYSYNRRVAGGMGDINGAGAYFAGAIVFTLEMLTARYQRIWQRLLLLAALAGSGVGMILPASRGAILGCGVAAGFQAARGPIRLVLVLLAGFGLVMFTPQHVKDRFTETQEQVASGDLEEGSSGRVDIWKATLEVIEGDPILGVGFGKLPEAMAETSYGDQRVAHNLYLEVWAEMGIPGLVLLFVIFIGAFRAAWKLRRESGFARILANGYIYFLIALLVSNVFGGRLFSVYSSGSFCMLTALVFRAQAIHDEERARVEV